MVGPGGGGLCQQVLVLFQLRGLRVIHSVDATVQTQGEQYMFAWPASMKQVFLRWTDTSHDTYVAQGKLLAPNFGVYLSRLSSSARASSSLRVIDSQSLQHSNHLVLNSYSAKKRCTHQMTVRVQRFGLLLPLLSLGCYSHCHLLQSECAAPGLTSSLKGLGSLLDCPGTLCDIVFWPATAGPDRPKPSRKFPDRCAPTVT